MATRLNRQIGYIKPKESLDLKISQEVKFEEITVSEIPDLIKLKSKKITSWIKSHPAIKWSFICKSVGIDKGNFQKILKSDSPIIKIENIIKLEKELKKYGYE
jgi:hypothetical protein